VTRRGVAAEAVQYDLNIASDALRDGGYPRAWANSYRLTVEEILSLHPRPPDPWRNACCRPERRRGTCAQQPTTRTATRRALPFAIQENASTARSTVARPEICTVCTHNLSLIMSMLVLKFLVKSLTLTAN
jgi:hypothetical protein